MKRRSKHQPEGTIKTLLPGKIETWGNTNDVSLLRYHYTSPEAFLQIIREKTLRFSDVDYMNDKSESIYFLKVLLDFMDADSHRLRFPRVQEAINLLLGKNDFRRIQALDIDQIVYQEILGYPLPNMRNFLLCACKENDALNMWNYYVHNGQYQGYNIGLKMERVLRGFTAPIDNEGVVIDGFTVYYGEVLYSRSEQYAELECALGRIENSSHTEIKFLALDLWLYITGQGLFYKHPKFRGEKEFRVVIHIAEKKIPHSREEARKWTGHNQNVYENFYIKNGLIVPCLSVSIPDDAISRITVAPGMEFSIAKRSVREILTLGQFKNAKIYQSTIPVRF